MHRDLRAKAGAAEPETPAAPQVPRAPQAPKTEDEAPKTPKSPKSPSIVDPDDEGVEAPEPKSAPDPKSESPGRSLEPGDGKPKEKVNPWKLVEEYKGRTSTLEKEISELRRAVVPEQDRKTYDERLKKIETRNKELEDEIRFVNYAKSSEFQEKYDKPYYEAFDNAMAELSQIPFYDPSTGDTRAATEEDLARLARMSLPDAKEFANTHFPDFATEALAHRREVEKALNARNKALDEARKNGAAREKEIADHQRRAKEEFDSRAKAVWDRANEAVLSDEKFGKYFTPIEGDQEGNQRLAKGYQMVDRAFNENIYDPNLTNEQRESVIKRHAAVRHRAAAFSRLRYQNEQLEGQIAKLKEELENYQKSDPNLAGSIAPAAKPAFGGSAKARLHAELQKLARPQ